MIRELKEEIERLRQGGASAGGEGGAAGSAVNDEELRQKMAA